MTLISETLYNTNDSEYFFNNLNSSYFSLTPEEFSYLKQIHGENLLTEVQQALYNFYENNFEMDSDTSNNHGFLLTLFSDIYVIPKVDLEKIYSLEDFIEFHNESGPTKKYNYYKDISPRVTEYFLDQIDKKGIEYFIENKKVREESLIYSDDELDLSTSLHEHENKQPLNQQKSYKLNDLNWENTVEKKETAPLQTYTLHENTSKQSVNQQKRGSFNEKINSDISVTPKKLEDKRSSSNKSSFDKILLLSKDKEANGNYIVPINVKNNLTR